jgi:hypothetical protein
MKPDPAFARLPLWLPNRFRINATFSPVFPLGTNNFPDTVFADVSKGEKEEAKGLLCKLL